LNEETKYNKTTQTSARVNSLFHLYFSPRALTAAAAALTSVVVVVVVVIDRFIHYINYNLSAQTGLFSSLSLISRSFFLLQNINKA
jgi:hypothetical protein